jgi:hypothetical protein
MHTWKYLDMSTYRNPNPRRRIWKDEGKGDEEWNRRNLDTHYQECRKGVGSGGRTRDVGRSDDDGADLVRRRRWGWHGPTKCTWRIWFAKATTCQGRCVLGKMWRGPTTGDHHWVSKATMENDRRGCVRASGAHGCAAAVNVRGFGRGEEPSADGGDWWWRPSGGGVGGVGGGRTLRMSEWGGGVGRELMYAPAIGPA